MFSVAWPLESDAVPLLGLYLIATTVLFGSVPWSKFSHMFYKPAAAFQKRVAEADVEKALRAANCDVERMRMAVLEADGNISIIPR